MLDPSSSSIAIDLFFRLLGFVYLFAIGAFLDQIRGLLGQEGILPISGFLEALKRRFGKKVYYLVPTLFWLNSSDKMLTGTVLVGIAASLCLIAGFATPWMLLLLFILFLSIVSSGQDFLSFGWEMFLLEMTANAFLLALSPHNVLAWISLNFLLFRFHFQAGIVKLQSKDASWRNLTGLAYHYQTQPIPNVQAWFFHKLPLTFHKFSTLFMFAVELAICFGIFGNETMRFATFVLLFGLQFTIWFTGNFSYLNHLTAAFCVILISNRFFPSFFSGPAFPPAHPYVNLFVGAAAGGLLFLQIANFCFHVIKPYSFIKKLLNPFSPFHIVNRYGIFAVMTTQRYEIVVEGSNDGVNWKEYLFKHKPSEVSRRPHRIAPYQPRLDWQAWFLPFSSCESNHWFQNFLYRLLTGSPPVLRLLREVPFDQPPKYLRALAYLYTFTSWKEKRTTGDWWKREFKGIYAPTIRLEDKEKG